MAKKAKILVIDDEKVMCMGCQKTLEQDGMEVECAENGIIGLAKLQEEKYDLVLVDLMMPQLKGTQVLESIRKYDPNMMIIIITGYVTNEMNAVVLEKGAFDYLAKPFTAEELRKVVFRALQARRNASQKLSV